MATATLTGKGQMVIPKPIRDYLHLHAGDNVDFLVQDNGDVLVRPAVEDVRHLRGILFKVDRKPVSLEIMHETIRQRGARRQ